MKYIALVLALAFSACTDMTGPKDYMIPGAVELTTLPADYAAIWAQVDSCTGITRPMTTTFYTVPDLPDTLGFRDLDGVRVTGLYDINTDRIFVSLKLVDKARVVRHEMVHAHLPAKYAGQHPDAYFGPSSKCGVLGL